MSYDTPSGYTTYYNISLFNEHADPGSVQLNANFSLIDTKIHDAYVGTVYTASPPINKSMSNVFSLNYISTNLRLNSTSLDTIQDIATTSSPTFASLYLNNNFSVVGTTHLTGSVAVNNGITISGSTILNRYVGSTGDYGDRALNVQLFSTPTQQSNPSERLWGAQFAVLTQATAYNYYDVNNIEVSIVGSENSVQHQGSGNIQTAAAIMAYIENAGTGSITNAIGLKVTTFLNGGAITNAYGIRIGNINTATNNWAIYSEGGKVYFGGATEIANNLTVEGNLSFNKPSALVDSAQTIIGVSGSTTNGLIFVPSDLAAHNGYLTLSFPDSASVRFGTAWDGHIGTGYNSCLLYTSDAADE